MNTTIVVVHSIDENVWQKIDFQNDREKVDRQAHESQKVQKVDTAPLERAPLNGRAYVYATITKNLQEVQLQ